MTRWFITLPTFSDVEDALDWCAENNVTEPKLHLGDDGRIRGRGQRAENETRIQSTARQKQ